MFSTMGMAMGEIPHMLLVGFLVETKGYNEEKAMSHVLSNYNEVLDEYKKFENEKKLQTK